MVGGATIEAAALAAALKASEQRLPACARPARSMRERRRQLHFQAGAAHIYLAGSPRGDGLEDGRRAILRPEVAMHWRR